MVFLVVRRVIHIWQRGFVKWCARCYFGCTKSKDKGKSQAGGLGTGCRSRGPNQENLLCLRLLYFLRSNFLLLQVLYFCNANIFIWVLTYILDLTIGIILGPTIGIRARPGIQALHTQSTTYKDGNGVSFIIIQRRTFYTTSTAIWRIQLQLLEV